MSGYSQTEREQLAAITMAVLQRWSILDEIQLALLGLPATTPARELTKLRRGKALPDTGETLQRAIHIVGIDQALGILHPLSPGMAGHWLTTHSRFFQEAPLAVMLEEGLAGMDRVWSHLDCTRNWQ